jgi:O-antigen ligase
MKYIHVPVILTLAILGTAETALSGFLFFFILSVYLIMTSVYHVYSKEEQRITVYKTPFALVFIFISIYLLSTIVSSVKTGFRIDTVMIVVLCYNLLVLVYIAPKATNYITFLHWISIIPAAIGGLGVISLVIGDFNLIGISISISESGTSVLGTSPIESIFSNQNGLARVTGFGVVSSSILLFHKKRRLYVLSFLLCLITMLLTGSRSSVLLICVGLGTLIIIYINQELKYIPTTKTLIILAFSVTFVYIVGFFLISPNILRLVPISLTGRIEIWIAMVELIKENYLMGTGYLTEVTQLRDLVPPRLQGLSPHNAYLKVFLHGGVAGGVAYLLFLFASFLSMNATNETFMESTMISIPLVFVLLQSIEQFSIIGLYIESVIFALSIGYGIKADQANVPSE